MKFEIVSDNGKNYLRIPFFKEDGITEFLSKYERNILEINSISGISKGVKKRIEGETYLVFPISVCISLKEKFNRENLNVDLFRDFFTELRQVYENMNSYLLDSSMICLNPEYIFYDEKAGRYIFLPIDERKDNMAEKYESLFTFFADVCSVEEKELLEFIFESFSTLSENGFDEMVFVKEVICHKFEKQIVDEPEEFYEYEEEIKEEEIDETTKIRAILVISGILIVLAFGFSYIFREEFKFSIMGMVTCTLAVGLLGYAVLKNVSINSKNKAAKN